MDQLDLFTGTPSAGTNAVAFEFNSADFVEVTTRGGIILRPILSETITEDTMFVYHRYWCALERDMNPYMPGML
jgi:nitrate reductase alpha subunit